ncbi:LOW QUALITY PROTEIN: sodium-dependent phosphate transport protein 2A-like [Haliotis rubra]|uniref:LOW QUALITY PROTEIN: sodium-dependent phosphate transport protein 2A-like n=1 Tax=Haliotis rubra TaxID=36100 RepID=UPI001EE5C7A6|nr:LOW QUALITY PROTEIN: sodium-dependent phosphate transport protein 2A-like [Haliotis rubra]
MTIPENVTSVKSSGKDRYELITDLKKDMPFPLEKSIKGESGGADSGFSSRNSVSIPRPDEDEEDDTAKETASTVLVVDGDAMTEGKPIRTFDGDADGCQARRVPFGILKILGIVCLLYLFICSLDLLGNAFQLLGGKAAGKVFTQSDLLLNPITGLMMGILATVLLQSSSTSTSIIITMVSSGIIEVQPAIPIIMGCNIGTTVTNTLVSLAHSSKGKEFERAFSGATVHDVFNWLTVLILLPLEASTHMLYRLTDVIVSGGDFSSMKSKKTDLLKKLTKPLTKMVVQIDKKVITQIAESDPEANGKRILKTFCTREVVVNVTEGSNVTETCDDTFHAVINHFHGSLNDTMAGVVLLIFSIILLTICLICIVKLLNSMLKDKITVWLKKVINAKLPYPVAWLTGYLVILIGAGLTILVQSSSVFTSALTPLVGVGCLKLRRMYPLTLGSNIGTTATGILAALAAPSNKLGVALQLALCHLFFNICGIALFYPVHPMRKIPINAAKFLGKTTNKYRWFAVFYLVLLFFLMPGFFFALSMAGTIPFVIGVSIIGLIGLFVVVVNVIQSKRKTILPKRLQTWEWLPVYLRSLEPLDKIIKKITRLFSKCSGRTCCLNESDVENQSASEVPIGDDEDDVDDDDDAVEDDECTALYGKLCCASKKTHIPASQEDEGFEEPIKQNIHQVSHIRHPIYTPPGRKKNMGRLCFNQTNSSPSSTPLLHEVTKV